METQEYLSMTARLTSTGYPCAAPQASHTPISTDADVANLKEPIFHGRRKREVGHCERGVGHCLVGLCGLKAGRVNLAVHRSRLGRITKRHPQSAGSVEALLACIV